MRQNVLITGGNGLIGSAFDGGLKISSKDCNLINPLETQNLIRGKKFINKIDSVIHAAAKVGGLGDNMSHQADFFYKNVAMNMNVIEACRMNGIEKLIVFLSTCIFPDKVDYPLDENKIHLGPPHESNYGYAYAKRMAEVQVRAYREQYGLKYTCVVPTNVYGPNDNFNLENGHVVPMLIHKCYKSIIEKKPFVCWGTGKPLREFIYSEDVAKLTEWALDNYSEDKPLILSTSQEMSIKELATLIADTMNYKGQIIWRTDAPDGQYRKPSDNSRIRSYLPDFKFTRIEDGIKSTVDWFIENFEKARK